VLRAANSLTATWVAVSNAPSLLCATQAVDGSLLGVGTDSQVYFFRFGSGAVNSGALVQLFTSQYLPDLADIGTGEIIEGAVSNALGAWADQHDCYYYATADYINYTQQYWTVSLISGSGQLTYGSQVHLVNQYYNQGLIANGIYLTTASGNGDTWTLSPAPNWTYTAPPTPAPAAPKSQVEPRPAEQRPRGPKGPAPTRTRARRKP